MDIETAAVCLTEAMDNFHNATGAFAISWQDGHPSAHVSKKTFRELFSGEGSLISRGADTEYPVEKVLVVNGVKTGGTE